jgi:alkylation response protein AidB-like acyl-CoA dehydrogenase
MTTDVSKVLLAVRELAPSIAARSAEIEAGRRLPTDLLAQLKRAGCFRMFVPQSHGGEDVDLLTGLEVIETLARADGSVGWTVMIGSESPHLFAMMERPIFDRLYANGPDVIFGGAFNATGQAEVVKGGYRVTGLWGFASGCQHADWLFGNCVVVENGKPRTNPDGSPVIRAMMFHAKDVRIVEHWNVLGLRGTGSHDIAVEACFVPEEHSFSVFQGTSSIPSPSFVAPVLHCAIHMGAVALGIAQGALDEAVALANGGKHRLYARAPLVESPVFQLHLGRAETTLRSARAALREVSGQFWRACSVNHEAVPTVAPQVSATLTWVAETTASVVDTCFKVAGSTALRDECPLQRRFRDSHTFTQHAGAAEGWFIQMGAAMLGKPVAFSY